ncbi:growth hormone-releasing hormone receptor-like [Notechis scutatus]|uniref:Growth hormone-releasing hormone receptor n=1 Tax=Notechis scutatus TaxID=8663 RepID=A0A6J1VTN8_9SAUR|nr:growth hormone-releasing hormone receptor-like [Notechis scutatus]
MKSPKQGWFCVLSLLILPPLSLGTLEPDCVAITEWKQNETDCLEEIQLHMNETAGCKRLWDRLLCWPDANLGESFSFNCPGIIFHFTKESGKVKRSCTDQGWSDPSPPYSEACSIEDDISLDEVSFFSTIQTIYTVGYSISATTLAVAIFILLAFRRLRCSRNYIHVHLFVTFILKAMAIFIKDSVLLDSKGSDYCTYSTPECKISMVFLNFSTMANFMWLLVEAIYLNCLLLSSFSHGSKYYWWLVLFGWGKRFSKSTLLLIPLFGTHYIIFNFLPEYSHVGARLYLELCIGSFQGFAVAFLYCFLNQEVQAEVCRKWRGNNYEFMMPIRRRKTKWTMPSASGIKVTNLMFKN